MAVIGTHLEVSMTLSTTAPTGILDTTDMVTLMTVLKAAGRAGVATLLWGPPGTGKSSVLAALAETEGLHLETVIASLREPSDFSGLPVIRATGVDMEPPAWAHRLVEAESGYLFLDELSTAPPAVQAALLRVVLDGVVGDLTLPKGIRIIAAANPPDMAADGWDLPAPQANRFLHIDFNPSTDSWIEGMISGFPTHIAREVLEPDAAHTSASRAKVAAFIRRKPSLLHVLPTEDCATGRAWPSRRTWTMTADVLALLNPNDEDAAYMAASGLVGPGPALEYLTWLKNSDLPEPHDVLTDPKSIPWATMANDRLWATLDAVVAYSLGAGTKTAWRAAWTPLAHAAEAGRADIAALSARTLLLARPTNTTPPREARAFTQALTDAELLAA